MADLATFLSDTEDDVRALEDLSALLLLVLDDGRDTFSAAEACGLLRVVQLQAKHAGDLLVKWAATWEASQGSSRRMRHD